MIFVKLVLKHLIILALISENSWYSWWNRAEPWVGWKWSPLSELTCTCVMLKLLEFLDLPGNPGHLIADSCWMNECWPPNWRGGKNPENEKKVAWRQDAGSIALTFTPQVLSAQFPKLRLSQGHLSGTSSPVGWSRAGMEVCVGGCCAVLLHQWRAKEVFAVIKGLKHKLTFISSSCFW